MAKRVAAAGSVVIARPISEVFGFFADAENDPMWRSGVKSIRRRGELGVGTEYEQTVAGPGGRGVSANVRVTAFEPERRVAFEATSGPVRPEGEYRFETVDGGTRVTFSLAAQLSGLKSLVMSGPVQKTMDAEVGALSKAKEYLEKSA
ncbi:SRPBCC family protein [Sinomonas susongensis]|uniref:SRPBCC family protein n=1 Tax=Sinomonas susongensis TaxID=1324851 RepID=UPI00148703E7|nr:SRPBCC family protein [Sinomonas susongensis]